MNVKKKIDAIAIAVIMVVLVFAALIPTVSADITYAGAEDDVAVGTDSNTVTGITLTCEGGEIPVDSNVNITLMDADVTFDLSVIPTMIETTDGGAGDDPTITLTTQTATELGFTFTVNSSEADDVFTLADLQVNVTNAIADETVVNFNITTGAADDRVSDTTLFVTAQTPTIAGVGDTLYSDNDGEDSKVVTPLTITSTVAGDIGDGTSINITSSDPNIEFDLSQEPDVAVVGGGIDEVVVTKFTETEIGMNVSGDSFVDVVINVGGGSTLRVNVTAAAPDTEVVNFIVKTTPADGSDVSQVYDALDIEYEYPGLDDITFTQPPDDGIAGTTVPVIVHAKSDNIADYGGCVIDLTIIDAPEPYGDFDTASWNTTGNWVAQLTTGSDGNTPVIGLNLSTRSSDVEDGEGVYNKIAVKASDADITRIWAEAAGQDGDATQIIIDAHKGRAVSDGGDTIVLITRLRDAYMNIVNVGNQPIEISTNSDTATAFPVGASNFANGEIFIFLTDTVAEPVTVTVTTEVEGISAGSKTVSFFDGLIIQVGKGWSLISIPKPVAGIDVIEEDLDAGLSHDKNGWLPNKEDFKAEFRNPGSAIYIKANKDTTIGFIWTEDETPGTCSKELGVGWNLIGVSQEGTADALLSQLQYSYFGTEEGMMTMYNPDYNCNKEECALWDEPMYGTVGNIPDEWLCRYDGYWIYMGSADGELSAPKNYLTTPLDFS